MISIFARPTSLFFWDPYILYTKKYSRFTALTLFPRELSLGKIKTVHKVQNVRLREETSTWVDCWGHQPYSLTSMIK